MIRSVGLGVGVVLNGLETRFGRQRIIAVGYRHVVATNPAVADAETARRQLIKLDAVQEDCVVVLKA